MGVVKGVLLLILGASLYVASLVAVPVEEVRVEGLRHLSREAVLQTLRLAPGDPWLWVWGNRLRPLLENPWVAEAHLEKPALGQVVVRVRERRPFLPLETGDALAEDGVLLPQGAPSPPGPGCGGRAPPPGSPPLFGPGLPPGPGDPLHPGGLLGGAGRGHPLCPRGRLSAKVRPNRAP